MDCKTFRVVAGNVIEQARFDLIFSEIVPFLSRVVEVWAEFGKTISKATGLGTI